MNCVVCLYLTIWLYQEGG